jgi:FHA domain
VGGLSLRWSGRAFTLGPRCLIGRHRACDLRIDDPRVSGEHASLYWTDGRWELRDLGSRNGTFLEGRRLAAGERGQLTEGATFTLGGMNEELVLADASAPSASARSAASGIVRAAVGGLLVLPDDEHPELSVLEDAKGRWIVEAEDGPRSVADHAIVIAGGEAWTLELPSADAPTLQPGALGPALETIHLRLAVSRDEERVEVTVLHGSTSMRLPPRSHHYLLVTLARARLNDRREAIEERGWLDRDELCRMLATDVGKLNVDIFRTRKQLVALGILGAAGIIARREGTGQIRIGTDRFEVTTL